MAEVVLFRPPETYSHTLGVRRCPLGLAYLAGGLLEHGISVAIIDSLTCRNWREAIGREVGEETICVGVSVMTGYPIRGALEFTEAVKRIRPVPVVWGGIHPSMLPEQTIEHEQVDVLLVGEGEQRFRQVVECLRENRGLDEVPGVYYRHEGEVRRSEGEIQRLDLDQLPFPAYHLLDVESYATHRRRFMGDRRRCLDLNTDRGCPYRCGFCYNHQYNQRRWRAMSAPKVLDALERLVGTYDLDAVDFVSDNFFVDKKRVRAICQGIIDRSLDIAWHADVRIDAFLRFDHDLVDLIRRSGCTTLTFGVESGSDRMLSLIKKDITVEQVKRAHARALEYGFLVDYHFMMGLPGEEADDVYQTLELIWHLGNSPNAGLFGPTMYVPYPGTPLYDHCRELGFQPPDRLEDWVHYEFDGAFNPPWFSRSFHWFLREAAMLASAAYGTSAESSFWRRSQRNYFRCRFAAFQHGVRLFGLDQKLVHLAKRSLGRKV